MEVLRELMKKPRQTDLLAIGLFVIAVFYTIYRGTAHTILVGLGFTLIVLGALPHQVALAFLVGASAIMLVQTRAINRTEGFSSAMEGSDVPTIVEDPDAAAVYAQQQEEEEEDDVSKGISANAINNSQPELAETFSDGKKKPMLPDNTDRAEPLVLGKEYVLPKESDDKGFHLDAGTTFLNAYKALKPEQITAMTKDTQDLLATQKSLVAMLDSFGPLMKDMGKITGFFGPSQS